jgi:hypothetical protein
MKGLRVYTKDEDNVGYYNITINVKMQDYPQKTA